MLLGHFCRSKSAWIFLFALLISSGISTAASEPDSSCLDEGPLVFEKLGAINLSYSPIFLGEFRLPISSSRPDVVTHALAKIKLNQNTDTGNWWVYLDFSFPDPMPFGIPFSFLRSTFSWTTPQGDQSEMIDWSRGCSGPGRSMFPGQGFSEAVEIKNSAELKTLDATAFHLWGSRN